MICNTCGERMEGDGYTTVIHCPNVEVCGMEPDSTPVHCKGECVVGSASTSKVVVFHGGNSLLVSGFEGDALEFKGFVENGAWDAVYKGGVLYAFSGSYVMSSSLCDVAYIVDTKGCPYGHYNDIIPWAEQQVKELNNEDLHCATRPSL